MKYLISIILIGIAGTISLTRVAYADGISCSVITTDPSIMACPGVSGPVAEINAPTNPDAQQDRDILQKFCRDNPALGGQAECTQLAAEARGPENCLGHGGVAVRCDRPPADRSWHLLTISKDGTVTLLNGLTRHEAEYAQDRINGEPATPAEVKEQQANVAARTLVNKHNEALRIAYDLRHLPRCPGGVPIRDLSPNTGVFGFDSAINFDNPIFIKWEQRNGNPDGCVDATAHVHRWAYTFSSSIDNSDGIPVETYPPEPKWAAKQDMKLVEIFQ